jgi:hypothetical protein
MSFVESSVGKTALMAAGQRRARPAAIASNGTVDMPDSG